jgi:recombination protein RecT
MATQVAERTANPVAVIRQNLDAMAPQFKAALPAHVSVEKFTRVANTAIQNNPDLVNCDRKSLFGAIVRLAQDGLLPDGREAALVKFRTKVNGEFVDAVQAMPMISGILRRVRQSGEVAKISAQVVYKSDEFKVTYGFDEDVTHNPPPLDEPRGEPIGAYATAVLKDGSRLLEVMSKEEIEKVRSVSRSGDKGPWVQWWGEMARKTVMRRLSKRLPMSTDLEDAFERDATMSRIEQPVVEHKPTGPETPRGRLDALESHIEAERHDPATGEITDGEFVADDAPHPARAAADKIIAEVAVVTTIDQLDDIRKREGANITAMPGEIAMTVDAALNAAETRIRDLF